MDGKDGLILWTLGGAGVLLLYAAYSNKSPRTVLAATLGTPAPPAPSPGGAVWTPDGGGGSYAPTGPRETSDAPSSINPGPRDSTGLSYLFDLNGNMAGVVPVPYQSSPATYIAPGGQYV